MANFKIGHVKGADGKDGVRGSKWYEGTAITGNSKTATVFPDTGITDALIGDCYLNTNTRNIYKCITEGDTSTAKWEYMTCLSFIDGSEWDASTTYEQVTIVRHNGASYFALQSSVGQEPSEDSTYWRLIAKDGINGKDGKEIEIDTELSETSKNPLANSKTTAELNKKAPKEHTHDDLYYRKDLINETVNTINEQLDNKSDAVINSATGNKVKFTIENGIICAREA